MAEKSENGLKRMYILGLNAFHWDSSACLLKDGAVVAASEEERFNRIKHWSGLPVQSIEFCLNTANIAIEDIDHITTGHDPKAKLLEKIWYGATNFISADFIRERLTRQRQQKDIMVELANKFRATHLPLNTKFHHVEHHRSHLASAFFASPFSDSALLSLDAFGDFTSTMTGIGKNDAITVTDSISYPHSIGMFYTALTQFLGFHHVGDEYKVMGLAPYGKPTYSDKIRRLVSLHSNGKFNLQHKYFNYFRSGATMEMRGNKPFLATLFSEELIKLLGAARKPAEELTQYHKDIAASTQNVTEEIIFHISSYLKKATGLPFLSLAGGVAQNSVANGKIANAAGFQKIYVPPAGHDAGLAMGSALYHYHNTLKRPRGKPILSAYTGSCFTNQQIASVLEQRDMEYRKVEDLQLFDLVVDKILDNGVVGWFSGKAEFGPRALGARSILADPRNSLAKELLNSKIKRRESFRPFAPSVLKEYAQDYFELNDDVPFMVKVFPVKESKRKEIPAVTHVDGTGRLQTVDRQVAPRYYALIECFFKRTGVPILLNTSFNENEPIVNTPDQAIDCFLRTKMDMLVLENCVLIR